MKALLLTKSTPSTHLTEALADGGHKFTVIGPAQIEILLHPTDAGDCLYLDGVSINNGLFDVALFLDEPTPRTAALAGYLPRTGIYCLNSGTALTTLCDQWRLAQALAEKKVNTPKQFYCEWPNTLDAVVSALGRLPVMVCTADGSRLKLSTEESAWLTVKHLKKIGRPFVVQEYIGSSQRGIDITEQKALIFDGQVLALYERQIRNQYDWRPVVGTFPIDNQPQLSRVAMDAISALPGLTLATITLLPKTTPDGPVPYVIEINSSIPDEAIETTANNHWRPVVEYLARRAAGFRMAALPSEKITPRMLCEAYYSLQKIGLAALTKADQEKQTRELAASYGPAGNEIISRSLALMAENQQIYRGWMH